MIKGMLIFLIIIFQLLFKPRGRSSVDPHGFTSFYWMDVFLSEATERRAALERQTSPSQLPTALLTLEGMTSYRRIEEAFHCKLKGPVVVDKKTLVELQNFQTVCLLEAK